MLSGCQVAATSRIRVHLPVYLLSAVLGVLEEHGLASAVDLHVHPKGPEDEKVVPVLTTKELGEQTSEYFYIRESKDLMIEDQNQNQGQHDANQGLNHIGMTLEQLPTQRQRAQNAEEDWCKEFPTIPSFPDPGHKGIGDSAYVLPGTTEAGEWCESSGDSDDGRQPSTLPRPPRVTLVEPSSPMGGLGGARTPRRDYLLKDLQRKKEQYIKQAREEMPSG